MGLLCKSLCLRMERSSAKCNPLKASATAGKDFYIGAGVEIPSPHPEVLLSALLPSSQADDFDLKPLVCFFF